MMDFLISALPWVAMGLLLAVYFARMERLKKDGDKKGNYGLVFMMSGMSIGMAVGKSMGMAIGMLAGLVVGSFIPEEDKEEENDS